VTATQPTVILVDMMNLVFRCHYSFQNLSSDGKPTGVVYGVLKAIHDLRENLSKRIIFVWDHGIPVYKAAKPHNWRDDIMKGYKGTRKRDDAERALIFPQLKEVNHAIRLLGYESLAVMGLEADDLIAILAREITTLWRMPVMIFSTDQDFYQLLDPNTTVVIPKKEKGLWRVVNRAGVEQEYGISVTRWAEYLALGGDSSDNIKPQRGMGPKTAAKLIQSGVNLNKPLNAQPTAFLEKYGGIWETIQACYSAARVPLTREDPRVRKCLDGSKLTTYRTQQHWNNDQERTASRAAFEQFCADRELVTILSVRHQLFDTGEQPCTKPRNQPIATPPKPWRKRTLV
jgi:5'-3' exonuclease